MSKKSSPGDGTNSKGTKGGGLYGGHFAMPDAPVGMSLTRSLRTLLRSLRGVRA
jgi:hypothetical protein